MARHSKGLRHNSRQKYQGGSFSIAKALQKFKEGDAVQIVTNPSVHNGLPHQRYHGKRGKIVEPRGRAYVIEIKDHNKVKQLISRPEHLTKV